jgi:hypothetical protein
MKLSYDNITNKHKDTACVIALHGPSLHKHRTQIQDLQKDKKLLRISTNEWWEHFKVKPDYLVVSNGELNIRDSFEKTGIFCPSTGRQYPRLQQSLLSIDDIPLLYNMTADLTDPEYVEKNMTVDYLPYDTKHFKGRSCFEILNSFKKHHDQEHNLNFKEYGNNSQMWQMPDIKDENVNPYCAHVHGQIAAAWSRNKSSKCCINRTQNNRTLQEHVQHITGHAQHMGPGQTVGLFCVAFAIIMGCNPIYIVGLDLDYGAGYASPDPDIMTGTPAHHMPNLGNVGHWRYVFRDFLCDDMRILQESAALKNIEIVNLNQQAWYNEFTKGELKL